MGAWRTGMWQDSVAHVFATVLLPVAAVAWFSFFDQEVVSFPPPGYTLRWYVNAWEKRQFSRGFVNSLQVALIAASIGVTPGTMAALALVRGRIPGRSALAGLLLGPQALPGVIAGCALVFILCMNAYATPVLLGGSQFKMMAPAVYDQFVRTTNWPFGAALAFILLAVTLGLALAGSALLARRYRSVPL